MENGNKGNLSFAGAGGRIRQDYLRKSYQADDHNYFLRKGNDHYPIVILTVFKLRWSTINAGKRSLALQQAFNIREDFIAKDFNLPDKIAGPPAMGPFSGKLIDFDALRRSYYKAMGWETETGTPPKEFLIA